MRTFIFLIAVLFFANAICVGQKSLLINSEYEVYLHLEKNRLSDSVIIHITLDKRADSMSIFMPPVFTARWSLDRKALGIHLGDDFKMFRESYYDLIEIGPGKTKEFKVKIKNNFRKKSTVTLNAAFLILKNPDTKEQYTNRDFPDARNYKSLSYHFKASDLDKIK